MRGNSADFVYQRAFESAKSLFNNGGFGAAADREQFVKKLNAAQSSL